MLWLQSHPTKCCYYTHITERVPSLTYSVRCNAKPMQSDPEAQTLITLCPTCSPTQEGEELRGYWKLKSKAVA